MDLGDLLVSFRYVSSRLPFLCKLGYRDGRVSNTRMMRLLGVLMARASNACLFECLPHIVGKWKHHDEAVPCISLLDVRVRQQHVCSCLAMRQCENSVTCPRKLCIAGLWV